MIVFLLTFLLHFIFFSCNDSALFYPWHVQQLLDLLTSVYINAVSPSTSPLHVQKLTQQLCPLFHSQ